MLNATTLFKVPGSHDYQVMGEAGFEMIKYDYIIVDRCDVKEYLTKGWFRSVEEALEGETVQLDSEGESVKKRSYTRRGTNEA